MVFKSTDLFLFLLLHIHVVKNFEQKILSKCSTIKLYNNIRSEKKNPQKYV